MIEDINFSMFGEIQKSISLKDLLLKLGLTYNEVNKTYEISENNENLDKSVDVFLNDDIGISQERYKVVDACSDEFGNEILYIPVLNNIEIWKEDNVFPGKHIMLDNKEYIILNLNVELKDKNTLNEDILYELDPNLIKYTYTLIEFNIKKLNNKTAETRLVERDVVAKK